MADVTFSRSGRPSSVLTLLKSWVRAGRLPDRTQGTQRSLVQRLPADHARRGTGGRRGAGSPAQGLAPARRFPRRGRARFLDPSHRAERGHRPGAATQDPRRGRARCRRRIRPSHRRRPTANTPSRPWARIWWSRCSACRRCERQTFLLKHIEGWRLDEIAESLQTSINNVKSILFRAVRKLRVDLHVWRGES